jgi:alcohol dehydrogenase class IV
MSFLNRIHLISRLRIKVNRTAMRLLPLPRPFTYVGADASLALCRHIAGSGIERILVVTDRGLARLGLLQPMLDVLRAGGIEATVFSEVEADPGHELILAGVRQLDACQAQATIAIGGGSSLDCAKAILLCQANRRHPSELVGVWLYARSRRGVLPFYAVPTTAGTGSEVTIAAVVSDPAARTKAAIVDPKMVPVMVALDPKLTVGLPPFLTACTGMDALTHAVEAYLSTMATPETDGLARGAVTMILRNLPVAYRAGGDLGAREEMLVGSCMAGMAFTRTGVGYVHAFAHQLGALYHLPHGLANAILLPHLLELMKPACTARLAELGKAAALPEATPPVQADAFIARIRSMNAEMGIPGRIDPLRRLDFDAIIRRAFGEAHGTYGVPRYLDHGQALELLSRLLP